MTASAEVASESTGNRRLTILRLAIAGLSLASGLLFEFRLGLRLAADIAYILAALLAGPDTFRNAWRAVRRRRLGMSFLMTIAAIGAFATGHGEEGAAVLFLFAIAEELEEYAEDRARSSISKILALAPPTARVRRGGQEVEVPTDEVVQGELLILRPGEKIPLDGIVRSGSSSVNEAAISGESTPVEKQPGSTVFAASLVNEGYLEVEVTKPASQTLLARIVELVEQAEQNRAPTERFVDRFAHIYTPVVVASATTLATLPWLLFGQSFDEWLYRGLVLLVVACPCALVISTPVSFVSAITRAARRGVLVKGAEYIELIRGARVFAFDKTGTLTTGKLTVSAVTPLGPVDVNGILRIAAAIERKSQHPIANAIVERAEELGLTFGTVDRFESVTGRGVRAEHDGTVFAIGSPGYVNGLGLDVPSGVVSAEQERGVTAVVLADESQVLAVISVSDQPRPAASRVVAALHDRRVHTVMLTGDAQTTAEAIAAQVGIDEVNAELLPEEKVDAVKKIAASRGSVVVVGDGVNDAPALAEASVGIAMGAMGTDVAIETADIALMRDDLDNLPYLVELSHETMAVVRQNVIASIGIKGTLALLALPGLVSLWVAVAIGDMGLSLAVILNALRIGRSRR